MKTATKISNRTFFIAIHVCHICIYLLVIIIVLVLAFSLRCTITTLTETELFSSFRVIFRWFWIFGNKVIFRSTSKTFARFKFSQFFSQITIRTSFFLILFCPFEKKTAEWLVPPQKGHFFWTIFYLSLFLPEPELLSSFKYSVCRD